jgi:transposase
MIQFHNSIGAMMTRMTRPTFSPEFRLETAQLVVDQRYTHQVAAKTMD